MDNATKLTEVLKVMESRGVDALIVPSEDAHQTEYVATKDKRRAWISEFTGSAGTAVLVKDKTSPVGVKGYLWTDGRYFLQAEAQLPANWKLQKSWTPGYPTETAFLNEHFKNLGVNGKVAVDPRFVSMFGYMGWTEELTECSLVEEIGLIDEVRDANFTPVQEKEPFVFSHSMYAGETTESKLERIRNFLSDEYSLLPSESYVFVLSDLAEISWVLNLRGMNVIDCCTIFFGFLVISNGHMVLFSDLPEGDSENAASLQNHLELLQTQDNLQISSYDDFEAGLKKAIENIDKVFLPMTTSQHIYTICSEQQVVIEGGNIVSKFKAIKNETEMASMKQMSIEDSVAVVRYLHWLEQNITDEKISKGKIYDEIQVSDVLEKFRSEIPGFAGLSFPTISSYGSNAAIIHYQAEPGNALVKKLGTDSLYLVDSGGQYFSGCTTDVTRTVCLGEPTAEMKKYFTLVLDGHAHLASARAHSLNATSLDELARRSLAREGATYAHGTSHGVGSFLNVHEDPPSFRADEILEVGMCLSNEPGYYKDGEFGIRIESVVAVIEDNGQCCFETLNYIPMQQRLIDPEYLSETAKAWLNNYHADCLKYVGGRLNELGLDETFEWLKVACEPID